jgi:hypothetical protein
MLHSAIICLATIGLLVFGAWRKWLRPEVILLAVGLLAIPYFSTGYTHCMSEQGQFAAVASPI